MKVDNVQFVVQKMLIVSQFLITLYGIEIPNFNFGDQVKVKFKESITGRKKDFIK